MNSVILKALSFYCLSILVLKLRKVSEKWGISVLKYSSETHIFNCSNKQRSTTIFEVIQVD